MTHNTNDFGSIGWNPGDIPGPNELIGWGNELVGWGNELVGWGSEIVGYPNPEIIGCPGKECIDGSFGGGTDAAWLAGVYETETFETDVGFIPLIIAGIAAVASAVSAAATVVSTTSKVVEAVGSAQKVANYVEGGIKVAGKIIEAAKKGDPTAIKKLEGVSRKQKAEREANREKAKKKLAEVAVRAKQGDLKAQAILAGIQIITDKTNQKIGGAAKFMQNFRTLPSKQILDNAVNDAAAKDWESFKAKAIEAAKKSGKWPKKNPPVVLPVKAMVKASNKAGLDVLKRGNTKLKASKQPKGARGFLVTPGGQIRRGTWLPTMK